MAAQTKHKRGSTLTEMFKLAGDVVEDGVHMMLRKEDQFKHHTSNQWEDNDDYSDSAGTGNKVTILTDGPKTPRS